MSESVASLSARETARRVNAGTLAPSAIVEAFAEVPVHIEKCFKTSPFSLFTVVVAQNQKSQTNGLAH